MARMHPSLAHTRKKIAKTNMTKPSASRKASSEVYL